ncbi:hypothetical protein ACFLRF_04420 [Candidatus Altiarchaeota archaeon]
MSEFDYRSLLPKGIPVWELAIAGVAIFAMVIVFLLWYLYGYDLVIVPNTPNLMNPV